MGLSSSRTCGLSPSAPPPATTRGWADPGQAAVGRCLRSYPRVGLYAGEDPGEFPAFVAYFKLRMRETPRSKMLEKHAAVLVGLLRAHADLRRCVGIYGVPYTRWLVQAKGETESVATGEGTDGGECRATSAAAPLPDLAGAWRARPADECGMVLYSLFTAKKDFERLVGRGKLGRSIERLKEKMGNLEEVRAVEEGTMWRVCGRRVREGR